jgi:hypothetical protein
LPSAGHPFAIRLRFFFVLRFGAVAPSPGACEAFHDA